MMIYSQENGRVTAQAGGAGLEIPKNTVWIDLLNPTREEELAVEAFLGLEIPTREEMHEIEVSNRLYQDRGAHYMTATMTTKVDTQAPETHAVTFILTASALVTIRYVDATSFRRFAAMILKQPDAQFDENTLFLGLMDAIVNRIADILERLDRDIDRITKDIFRSQKAGPAAKSADYQQVLERIGRSGDLSSKIHESLVTFGRVAGYANHHKKMCVTENETELVAIRKDISGLIDHGTYLTGRVNFLLDATLGMISINQNAVFRVLSVASLIFLPPTLVAGIYGMNFKLMPELEWHFGYLGALVLMSFAAILPYAYLKQRKLL
ncbi:MAG: magnesium transporter CorA family protein [Pseudomonadota bacterium]